MDEARLKTLLDATFNHEFDKQRFLEFINELFNGIKPEMRDCTHYIAQQYKQFINSFHKVAEYSDPKGKGIEILVVKLNRTQSRDRARTMQRNFIADWLKKYTKYGALVAFYGDEGKDWRFSFIKMDYQFIKDYSGKAIVSEELTPAKRYSFLVGVNEPNHTCRSQFLPLLRSHNNILVEDLEAAFNIEKVSKEFFDNYKELFHHLLDSLEKMLEKDKILKTEFDRKNVDHVSFSKKLLGQIVFLYFLQKKGWLGVERNEEWGSGQKKFLRNLFEKAIKEKKNFFNDYLEYLFYDALAINHSDNGHYYSHFNCKIPFLNGGLFEPINEYDWGKTDIKFSNEIFSNDIKTKMGDIGNGILDVFDRFNFTVKEDEPLEKEVAVDPEMLGKVFENLLDVTDRKSKGAFYTPREIVHYMCQQSLINYLETNSGINRKDIEKFIQLGDLILAQIIKEQEQVKKYGKSYTSNEKYSVPNSISENVQLIDKLLKEIKVVDPAVGSGAFPVGMMNEIVRARSILAKSQNKEVNDYDIKRQVIEDCLYGVDIEPSAVEICKLRFWLSLIVDEDDVENIKPLPNLDYKIMCGNSLLEEFEGIKLFDESLLDLEAEDKTGELNAIKGDIDVLNQELHQYYTSKMPDKDKIVLIKRKISKLERKREEILLKPREDTSEQATLGSEVKRTKESKLKLKRLKELHEEFFSEESRIKKRSIKNEIDKLEWGLIDATLRETGDEAALEKLDKIKKTQSKPFFLWKLYFAEVFQRENPGFDVVIANPPYLRERDNKIVFEIVNNSQFGKKYHQGKMDYWFYFLHKAMDIVRENGKICYITSRYWLNSYGSKKLIHRIKEELSFVDFVDIGKLKVFDNVVGQHMVALYTKSIGYDEFRYKKLINDISDINKEIDTPNLILKKLQNSKIITDDDEIILQQDLIKNKEVVELGVICETSIGVQESVDKISNKQFEKARRKDISPGVGVFVLNLKELKEINPTKKEEKDLIKKYLDPNDLFRYGISNQHKKFLIYTDDFYKKQFSTTKEYLNIKKHLDNLKEFITSSNKPYGLHRPRESRFFENQKIIFKGMFRQNEFTYDNEGYYVGFSFSVIIQKDKKFDLKYILSILNSKLALHWFYMNGKIRGGGVDIGTEKLRKFPVKDIIFDHQKPFIHFVDQILSITKDDDYLDNPDKQAKVKRLEKEIDQLVYRLYELTPEEIEIVEEFGK